MWALKKLDKSQITKAKFEAAKKRKQAMLDA
jgi:hypothetical protein